MSAKLTLVAAIGLSIAVYGRGAVLAYGANAADYRAFDAVALAMVAVTGVLLWRLCGKEVAERESAQLKSD